MSSKMPWKPTNWPGAEAAYEDLYTLQSTGVWPNGAAPEWVKQMQAHYHLTAAPQVESNALWLIAAEFKERIQKAGLTRKVVTPDQHIQRYEYAYKMADASGAPHHERCEDDCAHGCPWWAVRQQAMRDWKPGATIPEETAQ